MKHGHQINKLSSFLYIMLLMNLVMLTVKSIYKKYVAFFRCSLQKFRSAEVVVLAFCFISLDINLLAMVFEEILLRRMSFHGIVS